MRRQLAKYLMVNLLAFSNGEVRISMSMNALRRKLRLNTAAMPDIG